MPTAIHKALVYRLIEDGWNAGDLEVVEQMTAPAAVAHDGLLHHQHGHAGPPAAGPEAGKRFVAVYRTAFPDLRFTVDDLVAEDDIVVARWRAVGTQRGAWLGLVPTGRRARWTGTSVFRFDRATITESWTALDVDALVRQLDREEDQAPDPGPRDSLDNS